jgi:hypothetical protein
MLTYSQALVTSCRNVLLAYELSTLTDDVAKLQKGKLKRLRHPGPFYVYLAPSSASKNYTESQEQPGQRDWILHPFYRDPEKLERTSVWIGFRMRFDVAPTSGLLLDHVTIQLARGEQAIFPLLRAEWDCRDSPNAEFVHSQPHWHVYPARLSSSLEPDAVDARWAVVQEHLHLAMCARWHNIRGSALHHASPGTLKELSDWLRDLLKYLRDQVEYGLRRVKIRTPESFEVADRT